MGGWATRPTDLPEAEAAFTPYLVPMVEVRRLVNEALAMGEEFSLSAWFSQCCFLAKAELLSAAAWQTTQSWARRRSPHQMH